MLRGKSLLAYVAGIIDGEGCISIRRQPTTRTKIGFTYIMAVTVGNTNEWLICFLKQQFGGCICFDKKTGNRKDAWRWELKCGRAVTFLELISPYLQLKKPNAEIAIQFQKYHQVSKGKRPTSGDRVIQEAEYILMKQYNKRGPR